MSVSGKERRSHIVADSAWSCSLLKLGDELLLGDVAILESFHQFCGLDAVISCLYHMSKTLSLD